jgi:hypothetical protein
MAVPAMKDPKTAQEKNQVKIHARMITSSIAGV